MDHAQPGRQSLEQAVSLVAATTRAVTPRRVETAAALHRVAAADIEAPVAIPPFHQALDDGWAIKADDTLGASPYAPGFSSTVPQRVSIGETLPDFADAVLPLPKASDQSGAFEIWGAIAPGEGMRAAGNDLRRGEVIATAGTRLDERHIALLKIAEISDALVRIPRVLIVGAGVVGDWLADLAKQEGADCAMIDASAQADPLETADLILVVAPSERRDHARRQERVLFSRIAMRPGEMTGCVVRESPGAPLASETPTIFIGARLESALAAWLLLIRPCLRRLAGATSRDGTASLPSTRKIVSAPGVSELTLLRRVDGERETGARWEPLATGDIPYSAIANADAWLLVDAQSEGFAAGEIVTGQFL
jgi:molybdopterin biosynthesis enzyme